MNMEQKERLYLIRWRNDRQEKVTTGFQVEAIRYSEGKWYKGQPQMDIIREATPDDLKQHPPEEESERSERDRCLERKWKELGDIPFDEADSPSGLVLAEDWWGFPKGTDREEIWHAFDANHSKGVAFLLYGEESGYICALKNEKCIYTAEWVNCNSCPISEEAEKEQPTGRWIIAEDEYGFAAWDECSVCGYDTKAIGAGTNYCPNCGAKMERHEEKP